MAHILITLDDDDIGTLLAGGAISGLNDSVGRSIELRAQSPALVYDDAESICDEASSTAARLAVHYPTRYRRYGDHCTIECCGATVYSSISNLFGGVDMRTGIDTASAIAAVRQHAERYCEIAAKLQ